MEELREETRGRKKGRLYRQKGMETEAAGQRRSIREKYDMRKKRKKDIRLKDKEVLYSTEG